MSVEIKKGIQLEIAHILLIDFVGYSKLSVNDQHTGVEKLNQIVGRPSNFDEPIRVSGHDVHDN